MIALSRADKVWLGALLALALALRWPAFFWGLPTTTRTLATFHPDEQISMYSLEKWNPKKLYFPPGDALYWGTFHLYTLAAGIAIAWAAGYLHRVQRTQLEADLSLADRLYRVARGVSVFFGLAAVLAAFWMGRSLLGIPEAYALAALTAWTPLQVVATLYAKPDCMLLFWSLLILGVSSQVFEDRNSGSAILAGFLCGLAAMTKYTAGVFFVIPGMAWLFSAHRAAKVAGSVLVGGVIGAVVGCPLWILHPSIVTGMLVRQFVGASDTPSYYHGAIWAVDYIRYFFPYVLSIPLTLCAAGGCVWCLVRGAKKDRWLVASFLVIYAVITAPKRQYALYAIPVLPFVLIFAARGTAEAYRSMRNHQGAKLWFFFSVIASLWTLIYGMAYLHMFWAKDSRVEASDWIETHLPAGSSIGIAKSFFWTPPALRAYHSPYQVIDPGAGDPPFAQQAEALGKSHPAYFVLSDFELKDAERAALTAPLYPAILKSITTQRYQEVTRFVTHPALGPLSWQRGDPPWDWAYVNPTIIIYKSKTP